LIKPGRAEGDRERGRWGKRTGTVIRTDFSLNCGGFSHYVQANRRKGGKEFALAELKKRGGGEKASLAR